LFQDGAGTTYDATKAQFSNAPFSTYTPYDYTSTLLFKQKVDNSMASSMRDCGECHVGGGANEYLPNNRPEARTPLRDKVFGAAVTAFNYFIDSYGTRGDGFNTDGTPAGFEPTVNDYSQTGVLEMDCLMCHLKDYSWEERKKAIRTGKFDASRVTGAHLGTAGTTDGTNVTYDPTRVVPTGDSTALKLASTVSANILPTPDSNNCVGCHMAEHAVDWKKRGDAWRSDAEVHFSIGCMGCHKRKDADYSKVGTSGFSGLKGTYGFNNISAASPGDDSKKLGQCDPAKGNAPYGSLWNGTDNGTKNCAGCHIYGGDYDKVTQTVIPYDTLNAPNPTALHQAKGLTAKIVQQGGTMNGVANAGHIDLMTCEACHSRKGNFTGGAMVDGTGTDVEGRLADHENNNVTRQNMTDKNFMSWQGTKLYAANLSTSMFWRDKNDVSFDANNDGRAGGMDALLQTHVAKINRDNTYSQGAKAGQPLVALTQLGTVTAADIADHISAIDRDLEYELGFKAAPGSTADNTKAHVTRLSFMGVTFKTNHDISPAANAWGAGGCADCHKGSTDNTIAGTVGDTAAGGFYNGKFTVKGDTLNISWTAGTQVTPFASVNGSTQPSDFHPGVKEKGGVRSIAVQFASNGTTIRDIDRSEGLYENAFKARNTTFNSSITGTAITFPAATSTSTTSQGWLLKIEAKNAAGDVVARTKQVSALITDMAALLTNLGSAFTGTWDGTAYTGGQPEFGIRANAAGTGLLIEARPGYTIRLHPQSDVGPLGLAGSLWVDKTYAGVATGQTGAAVATSDRKTWVAYLNSFGDPAQQTKVGIGVDPIAQFSATFPDADPNTAGSQLLVNTPYTLAADTSVNTNGTFSYSMVVTDGTTVNVPSLTKTFTTTGTWAIKLTVTDEEGKTATATKTIYVVNPPTTGMTISPTTATRGVAGTYTFANLKDHDSLKIYWADGTSTVLANVGGTGSSATASHTYATTGIKKLTVLVYKNGVQVDSKYDYVTVGL
jgi:hypothetical protein